MFYKLWIIFCCCCFTGKNRKCDMLELAMISWICVGTFPFNYSLGSLVDLHIGIFMWPFSHYWLFVLNPWFKVGQLTGGHEPLPGV